jgi:hypothetical protein
MKRTYTITIDDDVPLTAKRPGKQERYLNPMSFLCLELKAGESFLYPATDQSKFNGLRSCAYTTGKRLGWQFATRIVKDQRKRPRIRVWRIK